MKSNLTSDYLGLSLKNPLLASSSPLTGELDSLKRLEDAGVGGVVLPSLFEEQVEHEEIEEQRLYHYGSENSPEVTGYFPELTEYKKGTAGIPGAHSCRESRASPCRSSPA